MSENPTASTLSTRPSQPHSTTPVYPTAQLPLKTSPTSRHWLQMSVLVWCFGPLVLLNGCDPDLSKHKIQIAKAQQRALHQATEEARIRSATQQQAAGMADAVTQQAFTSARALIEAQVPRPSWSMFPGLEGKAQRLRESIGRQPRDTKSPKPVLLLALDTTRVDHLSAWGYHRETSPHLEQIAAEGIRFSRFYSNGAWTRPSIASIMTSRYRGDHKCELSGAKLPDKLDTLAEIFQDNGYATSAIVGNQTVRAHYNFDQGFEHYEDIHDEIEHNPKAEELVDRAIAWWENNDNDNWFMWMFLVDPHDPYTPLPEYDRWETDSRWKKVVIPQPEYVRNPPKKYIDRMRALYDAEILQMDTAIGKMIGYLKDKGVWDDLTVVVVTDHGEAFGENRCFRHPYHFWEPNIHVGFMLRSPELKSHHGFVEDRLYQSVDVAPTIIDLVGLKTPETWAPSGLSAVEVMRGPITEGWHRSVYTELRGYGLARWMVRRGDYKYLRFNPSDQESLKAVWDKTWEDLHTANHTDTRHFLFDLSKDPWETTNLAGKRKHRGVFKAMANDLKTFRRQFRKRNPSRKKRKAPLKKEDMDPQMLQDLKALGYIE